MQTTARAYLPRQLLVPHEAFQRRCEINSAYYCKQQQRQQHPSPPLCDPRECSPSRSIDGSVSPALIAWDSPSHATTLSPAASSSCAAPRIGRILTSSSRNRASAEPVTVFHSTILPQLSLFELGCTMNRSTKCGEALLLATLVLAERYCDATKTRPTALMMHRLYVACLQVATKAHSDVYVDNAAFARLAGVSLAELNRLEREVIVALDWRLQVVQEELDTLIANGTTKVSPGPAVSHDPLHESGAPDTFALPVARRNAADASMAGSYGMATPCVSPSASCNISFGCSSADDGRCSKLLSTSPFSPHFETQSPSAAMIVDDSADLLACRLG